MNDINLWSFEKKALENGYRSVAGIDEAGRGPLAGPVVAAAVIWTGGPADDMGLDDSKKLSARKRDHLYDLIYEKAGAVGIGIIDPPQIDRINILQASLQAMAIAAANLIPRPDFLLIDGTFQIASNLPQMALARGDALSGSIAAASIVAKVTRDRIMARYDLDYPEYAFGQHKGYPTRAHRKAIRHHGICPIHRRSFRGVKEFADTERKMLFI
jgi:ribonuclease HII